MSQLPVWNTYQVLPSREGAIDELLFETISQLKSRGWDERDQYSVRLALEEAFNNAMEHGNRWDATKLVTVDCRVDEDRFWASVSDEGEGFDPQEVADCREPENLLKTRGRGLFLMRAYMDNVRFNDAGNRVLLEKRLSRTGQQR
jgi:serine/threonine-protein kinase RsbW